MLRPPRQRLLPRGKPISSTSPLLIRPEMLILRSLPDLGEPHRIRRLSTLAKIMPSSYRHELAPPKPELEISTADVAVRRDCAMVSR